jgi:hypothetical protein
MPCYRPSWDHQLQPGTQAHAAAKSKVDASRKSTYHIIDYYLKLCGIPLPIPEPTDSEIMAIWGKLVENRSRAEPEDLGTASIALYGLAAFLIANHLRCDGVTYEDLWDQQSILDISDPRGLGYGWIIRWCVFMMTLSFERERWSLQLTRPDRA